MSAFVYNKETPTVRTHRGFSFGYGKNKTAALYKRRYFIYCTLFGYCGCTGVYCGCGTYCGCTTGAGTALGLNLLTLMKAIKPKTKPTIESANIMNIKKIKNADRIKTPSFFEFDSVILAHFVAKVKENEGINPRRCLTILPLRCSRQATWCPKCLAARARHRK